LISRQAGNCLINELVGYAIERLVITPLDQQTPYDFLNGTVPQKLDQLQAQRGMAKQSVKVFDQWWPTASESEIISFYDRLKLYGESSALAWLQSRVAP